MSLAVLTHSQIPIVVIIVKCCPLGGNLWLQVLEPPCLVLVTTFISSFGIKVSHTWERAAAM